MNTYYKKLYKKTITLPFIKWEGVNDDNSDYYALLEKNYVPITSTETWDKSDDDWVQIDLKAQDEKFNRLIVKSCKQNDGEVRTRLFEFKAQVPVNGSNGMMINPCNSIYAIIRQEPKTDIRAVVKFEKLNDSLILSADSKTLEINGDELLVKIIYYGLKGNGDESVKIVSNISLCINGTNVDDDANVLSLERTANGIILLYKISENTVSNKQFDFVCTYTSDYGRRETDSGYIKQSTNNYKIELMCNNSTGTVQINSNSDNFNLYCKLTKNNKILKEKIELVYDYVTNSPIIIRTDKILNLLDNGLYVDVSIEKNFTPVMRKVSVYAKYKTYESNTIEIDQNSSSIQIYTVCDGNRVDTVNIDGYKQEKTVLYYAIATAAPGDTKQIISYTNTYSDGVKNIKLIHKDSEPRLLYDKDLNLNTRESLFLFEKNRTGHEKSYTVTYWFEGTDITKTINFKQNYINIDITPIGGNNGNIIIGGLTEYDPYVDILLVITENSASDDIDLADITVSITNGHEVFKYYDKKKEGNNIQIRYDVIYDLGFSGGNRNYESRVQRYDYTITYFNKTFTGTITRYPIYYGVNIIGGDEKVSGVSDSTVLLDIFAILYNRKDDWTHYIKAADNNLKITINPNTYVNQNITSTPLIKLLTLTHSKNDTGADRSLTVNVSYLDMNEQSTLSNTDPIVVTKKTITQDSVLIAAVILVWNEANTLLLTGNELSILEPWKTNVFTLKGYLIDDTDGNSSVITSTKLGEFIIKLSPAYKYDITSYNNSAGITTAKLTVYPTFIYDPNHDSFMINFKVEHGITFSTTEPAQILTYTITSYEQNKLICTDNLTYTSFYLLETDAFITSGTTVTIKTYVLYMTTQTSYYIDTEKSHYTLLCTEQPVNLLMTVDGNDILFTYLFSPNETTENKEYLFTLEYTNENYIGTPYHYYRHIKLDKVQSLTFEQPPLDYKVYISYELSFIGSTSKEINALEHADVYVYVKVMLGDKNVTINEGDIIITPSYLKFVKSLASGTILQYKVVDNGKDVVEMNIGTSEKTWTIYATYKGRNSLNLLLTQNYLTLGNRLNVTVSADPPSVDYTGGDVIFTYYLTYDSTKIDVTAPLSWSTSLDNNGTLTLITTTGTDRTCKYEYPLNTTVSNSITFTAEVLGLDVNVSNSVTVTQGGAEFDVIIETNHDTIDANGGSFILTYYGTINGTSTNENITLLLEPTDTYKPTSSNKDTSGNVIKETFNVERNMTENSKTFTYTVTFNAPGNTILTKSVTITLLESEFGCELNSNKSNLGASGGNFTLTYYGLINGTKTNLNVSVALTDNISFNPTPGTELDDNINNVKTKEFTVQENPYETERTVTYMATYTVNSKSYNSNSVTLTQAANSFSCYLFADTDIQTISGTETTTVTFTFYGEKSSGKVIDNVIFVCDEGNDNITITEVPPTDTCIANVVFNMNLTAYQKTYKFHAEYIYDGTNKKLSNYIVLTQEIPSKFTPVIIVDDCTYDTNQGKYLIPSEKIDSLKICYYGKIENSDAHITDINLFNELVLTQYNSEEEFECTYVSGPTLTTDYIYCIYSVPENRNKNNDGLLEPLFKKASVSLKNDETKIATCAIKQIGDEVYMADFDYFAFKYRIVSGKDLDTATALRTDKDVDFETTYMVEEKDENGNLTGGYHNLIYNKNAFVGFLGTLNREREPVAGSSINPMQFYGDNLSTVGYECVTVCIKDILRHSKSDISNYVKSKIYIDIFGSWFRWNKMYDDIKNPDNYGTLEIIFETYSKLDPLYTGIPFTENGNEYQVDENNARLVDRIGPFIVRITGRGSALGTGFRATYAHFAILEYDIKENKPKLYVVHNNENNKYDHTVLSLNMITGKYNERTRQDTVPYYYPTGLLYCLYADIYDNAFEKLKVDKFQDATFKSVAGDIDNCPKPQ